MAIKRAILRIRMTLNGIGKPKAMPVLVLISKWKMPLKNSTLLAPKDLIAIVFDI